MTVRFDPQQPNLKTDSQRPRIGGCTVSHQGGDAGKVADVAA